jgi:hypothetical protein
MAEQKRRNLVLSGLEPNHYTESVFVNVERTNVIRKFLRLMEEKYDEALVARQQ